MAIPFLRTCILILVVFSGCFPVFATERTVLDGKAFAYDSVEQLRNKCLQILVEQDARIKEKEKTAKSAFNPQPFREMAKRRLAELRTNRTVFLQTQIVAPAAMVICGTCHGAKKLDCGWCDGTGKSRCQECHGTGKVPWLKFLSTKCDSCGGNGKRVCNNCGGSLKVSCSACNGQGSRLDAAQKVTVGDLLKVKEPL